MKHGKKFNHLSRKAAHRKAMLSNMASSLIMHKRIETTTAKAKALKRYVEPLITKSKDDSTHSRRVVFSYLQDKHAVTELFREVAPKVGDRPGGYTRIIKTAFRLGDNADMCFIELVDFNDLMVKEAKPAKKKRRRRGGSGAAKATEAAPAQEATTEEVVEEAVETPEAEVEAAPEVAEEVVEEAAEETAVEEPAAEEAVEEPAAETEEAPEAAAEEVEAAAEESPEEVAEEATEEEASSEEEETEEGNEEESDEEKKD